MVDFFHKRKEVEQRQAVIESFLSTPTRGEEERLELTQEEAQKMYTKYESRLRQQVEASYAETGTDGKENYLTKRYYSLSTLLADSEFTFVRIIGTPVTEEGKKLKSYLQKSKKIL